MILLITDFFFCSGVLALRWNGGESFALPSVKAQGLLSFYILLLSSSSLCMEVCIIILIKMATDPKPDTTPPVKQEAAVPHAADWSGDFYNLANARVFDNKLVWRATQGILLGGLGFGLLLGLRHVKKGMMYGLGLGLGYAADETFNLKRMQ